jgi:hypothetical protein
MARGLVTERIFSLVFIAMLIFNAFYYSYHVPWLLQLVAILVVKLWLVAITFVLNVVTVVLVVLAFR